MTCSQQAEFIGKTSGVQPVGFMLHLSGHRHIQTEPHLASLKLQGLWLVLCWYFASANKTGTNLAVHGLALLRERKSRVALARECMA